MKPFKHFLFLALASALSLGVVAQDAPKPKDPPAAGNPGGGRGGDAGGQRGQRGRGDRLTAMATALSLTEEQKTKLKPILDEQTKQQQALREITSLSDEDRRAKGKTIRDEANAKIKAILTPEQQDKFEKMRQGGPRGGGRNGGGGGGRPGGGAKPAADAKPEAK